MADLKYFSGPRESMRSTMAHQNDVLVVRTNGSRSLIGRAAPFVDPEPMAFASYLIRFRPGPDLDPRYAAYALASPRIRRELEEAAASSAGQYNLTHGILKSLRLRVPSLDVQQAVIAEIERQLSVIDSLANALSAAKKRSAALRRAILERAFRGELVPHDPSDEPAGALLERIQAERAASTASPRRRVRSRA
jgi:type I restriction enzyme S subunit